ncbi:MAG: hypothetical protein FWB80_14900 [Defluviitaleaceae bacterium]|nr:hypothetical protein [Defluviitaleaceae bacterium]
MLKTDPELKDLIPPLSDEEFAQLEQNIRTQGCRDAIVTWRGLIVDGHNRHAICTKHDIPYKSEKISLPNRKAVILWILKNQLGRRNLSDATRIELAMQKAAIDDDSASNIRKAIARDASVCEATVQKYMQLKKAYPALLKRLYKGELKIGTAHTLYLKTKTVKKFPAPKPENPIDLIIKNLEKIQNEYLDLQNLMPSQTSEKNIEAMQKCIKSQARFLGQAVEL